MRRRNYWLLPDPASARQAMNDLLLARIAVQRIHFVARENADMAELHAANVLQTSDLVRAAQQGLVAGALSGAAIGMLAAFFYPIAGDEPEWGIAAVLAVMGGGFGAWASSMFDVPRSRVGEIEGRLQALHPQARRAGKEPNVPAFP